MVKDVNAVREFAASWLGKRLVTVQTGADGQPVSQIFVEAPAAIDRELYLGAVVDRASRRVVVMASTEGGVEIEQVAAETPEKILRAAIDPATGAQPFQGRAMAFALGLVGKQVGQFADVFLRLSRLFHECDCSLVEVNPLVVTEAGDVLCLDAKINLDNNALYRQRELAAQRDFSQEDEREARAAEFGLNLRRPRRQHRLHGERRRVGHGHDGPGEAARRRAGELSRRGRRRHRGSRRGKPSRSSSRTPP